MSIEWFAWRNLLSLEWMANPISSCQQAWDDKLRCSQWIWRDGFSGLTLKCFGEVCFVLLCLGSFLLPLQLCKDNNRTNRTGDLSPSLPLIKSHFLAKLWQMSLPSPSVNQQIICLLCLISSYSHKPLVFGLGSAEWGEHYISNLCKSFAPLQCWWS